jgi:hypothetical protein
VHQNGPFSTSAYEFFLEKEKLSGFRTVVPLSKTFLRKVFEEWDDMEGVDLKMLRIFK